MDSEIENIIKNKLNELEEKSKLYRLKRYEKKLMKKYRNILKPNNKKELIFEKIKENEKKFEKQIKEENQNFNKEKEINIMSYLESIKSDKKKLIEFFKDNKYF
jgi:hypothetical protein